MTDKILEQYGYEVAERCAFYEFYAGMTREEAEAKAIEDYNAKVKRPSASSTAKLLVGSLDGAK